MTSSVKNMTNTLTACAIAAGLLAACTSSENPDKPIEKRITMPEDPKADARARAAVAVKTQILAERVELYLPPGLYGELEVKSQSHSKDEFETGSGRRITLKPPENAPPNVQPARVNIGQWGLAARGKIDVLFVLPGEGPAARVRAYGVDLFHRDGVSKRGLPEVDLDDQSVSTPGVR
jgi:hypothetical protein